MIKQFSRSKKRGQRGFSLLEVMVASAFFVTAMAGFSSVLSTMSDLHAHQRHSGYALQLADSKLEDLLLRYRGDPEIRAGATHTQIVDGYTLRWTTHGNTPFVGVRTLEVSVSWPERTRTGSLTLKTVRP